MKFKFSLPKLLTSLCFTTNYRFKKALIWVLTRPHIENGELVGTPPISYHDLPVLFDCQNHFFHASATGDYLRILPHFVVMYKPFMMDHCE